MSDLSDKSDESDKDALFGAAPGAAGKKKWQPRQDSNLD